MGWKPGQGVGSRLTKKEKQKIKQRNEKLKLAQENPEMTLGNNSDDSDDDISNVTFAPDDYEPFRCKPKDNYFGIGYSGLDRRKILSSHINLFDTPAFCVQDKNKKLSIHGQAFGVGAFEVDDEDIYEREDMSCYDFSLDPERKTKTRWSQDGPSNSQANCLEGFIRMKERLETKKIFKPPELPKDFTPAHAIRKSRFYPPIVTPIENGKRKESLNAVDRARILEDPNDLSKKSQSSSISVASNIISNTLNLYGKQQTEERRKLENQQTVMKNSWLDKLNMHNFVKGGIVESKQNMGSLKKLEDFKESSTFEQSNVDKPIDNDSSNNSETKKLFLFDPDKQKRFEQYLIFSKNNALNEFESIQPLSMNDWEREQERIEFEQAAKLELKDYMADKFVHSTDCIMDKIDPEKDVKEAVRLKMFGKLTRERSEWKPMSIVCKRFNIPEPKVGCASVATGRKSTKFSIFESLDWSNSSKFVQATDTIKSQTQEISPLSKETRENANEIIPNTILDNIPSNIHESSKSVSTKLKIFEASYEKIFGKGIQSSSIISDIKQNTQDVLKDKNIPEIENKQEVAFEPMNIIKDQSEEKKDLFKAIFLSSSEDSDSESEENIDNETVKSILIGKDPKRLNAERNTSPQRGIFAKLDLDNLVTQPTHSTATNSPSASKISESPSASNEWQNDTDNNNVIADTSQAEIPPNIYGPALPQRLLKQESAAATTEANTDQSLKPVFRSVVSKIMNDSKLDGKWVERDKLKKSKKEKKKHKHKEHKSSKHKHKKKFKKEKRSKS